jgi:hypothetical protein
MFANIITRRLESETLSHLNTVYEIRDNCQLYCDSKVPNLAV